MQDDSIPGLRLLDAEGRECVTMSDLAKARGVTPEAVRQAVLSGRLTGFRLGRHHVVPLELARLWQPTRAGYASGPRKARKANGRG